MSQGAIAVAVILAPIILYALVRISSAAWYKSKQQFDNQQPKGR